VRTNKFWIIILCGAITLSAVAMLTFRQQAVSIARIYQNGTLTETVNLFDVTEPYHINLHSEFGTNVVAVEQGRIRVLEADCPDGACVRLGWVGSGVIPIVCLPHRVVIELHGDNDTDIDAVVG